MNISFDIDGTLDNNCIYSLMLSLSMVNNIYFISYRTLDAKTKADFNPFPNINHRGYYYLGNTNKFKLDMLKELNIDIHFDDDPFEVTLINGYARAYSCGFTAVLVNLNNLSSLDNE